MQPNAAACVAIQIGRATTQQGLGPKALARTITREPVRERAEARTARAAHVYGAELVCTLAARVVDERERVAKEIAEELGETNARHLCGTYRDDNDLDYMFGEAAHDRMEAAWATAL
jgi:hypothetical protein